MQSIEHSGVIYVRTDPRTWKVKRITRNPIVCIALSNVNGKQIGPWFYGEAHILEGEDRERGLRLFRKKYGAIGSLQQRIVAMFRREHLTTIISITLRPTLHQ